MLRGLAQWAVDLLCTRRMIALNDLIPVQLPLGPVPPVLAAHHACSKVLSAIDLVHRPVCINSGGDVSMSSTGQRI